MPITSIPGTEFIGDSRVRINNNFTALQNEKQNVSANLTALSGIATNGYLQKSGTTWSTIASIPAAWGSISGDLSSQLDLNTILSDKQNSNANLTEIAGLSGDGYLFVNNGEWSIGGLPGTFWGDVGGVLSDQLDLQTALNDKQNLSPSLTEIAGLSGDGYLSRSQDVWTIGDLPNPTWGDISGDLSSQLDLNTILSDKQNSNANLTEISGVSGDGYLFVDGGVWSVGSLPGTFWGDVGGVLSDQLDLQTALNDKQNSAVNLTEIAAIAGTGYLQKTGETSWEVAALPENLNSIATLTGDGTPVKTGSSWSLISGASGLSVSIPFIDINIVSGKFVELNNSGQLNLASQNSQDNVVGLVVSVNAGVATVLTQGVTSLLTGTMGQTLYLSNNGDATLTPELPGTKGKLISLGVFIGTNSFLIAPNLIGVG